MQAQETGRAIERRIVESYLPARARPGVHALLALDDRLSTIVAAARDPLIAQMRLTWWYEALQALDTTPPPAEPILRGLASEVLPRGVGGRELTQIVDGWEALLSLEAEADASISAYAQDRGATLFRLAAILIGTSDPRLAEIGAGWALAGIAERVPQARDRASAMLSAVTRQRWPKPLRALSGLAILARADLLADSAPGSVRRGARLLRHRLTGR